LRRNIGFDAGQVSGEAVVGVAQKDQAKHRHGIFGGGEPGIGAQLVGGFPQFVFKLLEVHVGRSGVLPDEAVDFSVAPPL